MSNVVILCPGQGAQAVGMARAWSEGSAAARSIIERADALLGDRLGAPLSTIMFDGPAETLNCTNVSQPAIYTASIASWHGMLEATGDLSIVATAGLSLGEYTALHLAGVFDFEGGLDLVARRGALMQEAAEASEGGMVALIGADDAEADAVCDEARGGDILVPANYNAPGQIVLSGSQSACDRAVGVAEAKGFRATALTVAGAFHSPLMQPAADAMRETLAAATMAPPTVEVGSNVTAEPHGGDGKADSAAIVEQIRQRLVEQIVSPVRWAQGCDSLAARHPAGDTLAWHELAPGTVLRGLMRRINRNTKVTSHDAP